MQTDVRVLKVSSWRQHTGSSPGNLDYLWDSKGTHASPFSPFISVSYIVFTQNLSMSFVGMWTRMATKGLRGQCWWAKPPLNLLGRKKKPLQPPSPPKTGPQNRICRQWHCKSFCMAIYRDNTSLKEKKNKPIILYIYALARKYRLSRFTKEQ